MASIRLSEVFRVVRRTRSLSGANNRAVEDIVGSILESSASQARQNPPHTFALFLDSEPSYSRNRFEKEVCNALVSGFSLHAIDSSILIPSLVFVPGNGVDVVEMVVRASSALAIAVHVTLLLHSITEAEAHVLFQRMEQHSVSTLVLVLGVGCSHATINTLTRRLRNGSYTSLKRLHLSGDSNEPIMAEVDVLSICSVIPECNLESLYFHELEIECDDKDTSRVANGLVNAIVKSPSMKSLTFTESSSARFQLEDDIVSRLKCTRAVKNFYLIVLRDDGCLAFEHRCWWKEILPVNIPLNVWPIVLEEADKYRQKALHSRFDIMFFLVKEKCDVLLSHMGQE